MKFKQADTRSFYVTMCQLNILCTEVSFGLFLHSIIIIRRHDILHFYIAENVLTIIIKSILLLATNNTIHSQFTIMLNLLQSQTQILLQEERGVGLVNTVQHFCTSAGISAAQSG